MSKIYVDEIHPKTSGGVITVGTDLINTERPAFRVLKTTQQTAAAANEVIDWDEVDYNQGSYWNSSTNRFVAPVAGLYLFGATHLTISNNSQTDVLYRVNGDPAKGIRIRNATGATQHRTYSGTFLIQLAVDDYVDGVILASSGTVYGDTSKTWTTFWGYLVG